MTSSQTPYGRSVDRFKISKLKKKNTCLNEILKNENYYFCKKKRKKSGM